MEETIQELIDMSIEVGISDPSAMNFCVSDGKTVIATRFINHPTKVIHNKLYSCVADGLRAEVIPLW